MVLPSPLWETLFQCLIKNDRNVAKRCRGIFFFLADLGAPCFLFYLHDSFAYLCDHFKFYSKIQIYLLLSFNFQDSALLSQSRYLSKYCHLVVTLMYLVEYFLTQAKFMGAVWDHQCQLMPCHWERSMSTGTDSLARSVEKRPEQWQTPSEDKSQLTQASSFIPSNSLTRSCSLHMFCMHQWCPLLEVLLWYVEAPQRGKIYLYYSSLRNVLLDQAAAVMG